MSAEPRPFNCSAARSTVTANGSSGLSRAFFVSAFVQFGGRGRPRCSKVICAETCWLLPWEFVDDARAHRGLGSSFTRVVLRDGGLDLVKSPFRRLRLVRRHERTSASESKETLILATLRDRTED
jgi:hypothetical protein